MFKILNFTIIATLYLVMVSCGKGEDKKNKNLFSNWVRDDNDYNILDSILAPVDLMSGLDLSNAKFGTNNIFYSRVRLSDKEQVKCTITADISGSQESGNLNVTDVSFIRDKDTSDSVSDFEAKSACAFYTPDKGISTYTKGDTNLTLCYPQNDNAIPCKNFH